jgi:hypothetical protein
MLGPQAIEQIITHSTFITICHSGHSFLTLFGLIAFAVHRPHPDILKR